MAPPPTHAFAHTHTHTAHHPHITHTLAPAASPLFPHAQTLFQWPVHAHTPPPVLTPLAALALPLPWDKRLQEEREMGHGLRKKEREMGGHPDTFLRPIEFPPSQWNRCWYSHTQTPWALLAQEGSLTDWKKPRERVATDSEKQLFKRVFLRESEKGDVINERGRVWKGRDKTTE